MMKRGRTHNRAGNNLNETKKKRTRMKVGEKMIEAFETHRHFNTKRLTTGQCERVDDGGFLRSERTKRRGDMPCTVWEREEEEDDDEEGGRREEQRDGGR
jgi:hypothetical protein